jgi:hypothetical protein
MLASALITDPISVLVVLLATLAGLFTLQHTRFGAAVYKVVPLWSSATSCRHCCPTSG